MEKIIFNGKEFIPICKIGDILYLDTGAIVIKDGDTVRQITALEANAEAKKILENKEAKEQWKNLQKR